MVIFIFHIKENMFNSDKFDSFNPKLSFTVDRSLNLHLISGGCETAEEEKVALEPEGRFLDLAYEEFCPQTFEKLFTEASFKALASFSYFMEPLEKYWVEDYSSLESGDVFLAASTAKSLTEEGLPSLEEKLSWFDGTYFETAARNCFDFFSFTLGRLRTWSSSLEAKNFLLKINEVEDPSDVNWVVVDESALSVYRSQYAYVPPFKVASSGSLALLEFPRELWHVLDYARFFPVPAVKTRTGIKTATLEIVLGLVSGKSPYQDFDSALDAALAL